MKKFIVFCLMAFMVCISANGQQRFEDGVYCKPTITYNLFPLKYNDYGFVANDYNLGFNVGFCNYFDYGYTGLCCGGEVYNISVEVATAGECKGENRYGHGGVSNDHRLMSVMLGYNGYLRCAKNTLLILNPKVGVCSVSQLYNDKYYGSDVANSSSEFEYGIDVGLWVNYFLFKVGITNMKMNFQMGFAFFI